jgi:hypothetical protein
VFQKHKGEVASSGMAFVPDSMKIRHYEIAMEGQFICGL